MSDGVCGYPTAEDTPCQHPTTDDGDSTAGYIPPAGWLAWAFGVCVVLAIAAWALGTLVWLVGV